MSKQIQLPFLPGNTFDFDRKPSHYRKSHAFDFTNGVSIFKEQAAGIGGKALNGQKNQEPRTSLDIYGQLATRDALGQARTLPSWVAFDRQVLRFYAYFQETVHERREEQYRVRKCRIYFYLEDDTVHVSEPATSNSGIPQGVLIRRHRIPKPDQEQGRSQQHFTVADFNVGQEVTLYGRTFRIVGCDQFTRDFLNKLNVNVPVNVEAPSDPYEMVRQELLSRMRATHPWEAKTALKKFLENDRHVLRFFCLWDDTASLFGTARHLVLHYFLADDTLEVRELAPDGTHTLNFLKRCRLPRPGPNGDLEYVGTAGTGGDAPPSHGYYNERDFAIGAILYAYGRALIICDMDTTTRAYYHDKYGIECPAPWRLEDETDEQGQADALRASSIPPYNGFGSEEDSRGSCITLVPKPPKKDFKRLMAYDCIVLRFAAALASSRQVDRDRRFVVMYYLADESLQIFEPHQRNSGIVGGKFLERARVKKPDGQSYYGNQDLYIGAQVNFHGHLFQLLNADEYALQYMAQRSDLFPQSNYNAIVATLRGPAFESARRTLASLTQLSKNTSVARAQVEQALQEAFRGLEYGGQHALRVLCRQHATSIKGDQVNAQALIQALL